ncbi:MAG: hypothetical protein HY397_00175 [Candidatus Doudnabacteria bacterium]|nr:hypothetical protein [Candidatus Doudnabacteria bacterium]
MSKAKFRVTFLILFGIVLLGLLLSQQAAAVPTGVINNIATNVGIPKYSSFSAFFVDFITVLLALVFLVAVTYAVISGYKMIISGGNEEMLESAKRGLTWSVLGMVVVLLAWVTLRVVLNLLEKGSKGV